MSHTSREPFSSNRRDFLKLMGLGASASVLAACGGGGGGGALGGGGNGKVTELIVPTNESPWTEAYQRTVSQYEGESGIRITLRVFPYDGLRTQMLNAIRNKSQTFDIFQLDEPWTHQFYDNDWVTPLEEIRSGFSLDPQILTYDALPFWDPQKRTSSESGQVMGLPLNGNVHLLVYRKDLYEDLGLSVPTTWEEAIANGEKAKSQGKAKYGYVTRGQGVSGGQSITYDYMPVFYSYGANWFADEGTDWTPTINTPEAIHATDVYKRLLDLGPADSLSVGQAEVIALLQGGEALQGHVVAAAAPQFEDESASNVAGKVGYAKVPAGGASGSSTPTSGTWSLCVPRGLNDARTKAAYDFVTWMLERKQQDAFSDAGGIATRKDSLTEAAKDSAYLQATEDSMADVRRAVRYAFSSPMLEQTERVLSQIGAGRTGVKPGLDQLQSRVEDIVREAGFLK